MFGNSSVDEKSPILDYSIKDNRLPFKEYIARTRAMIEDRRAHLHEDRDNVPFRSIIDANSPYELYPKHPVLSGERIKYGALLVHGLFDCPFSLLDIGGRLQKSGVLCRSILLPGHGTVPSDLLSVSYQDWLQALHYGIAGLRDQVEKLYLIGYSTGAALSIYQALQDEHLPIAGMILISPAISIKPLVDMVVGWRSLTKWLHANNKQWIFVEPEIDYAKYLSIPFNPVVQLASLTQTLRHLGKQRSIRCPIFMILSKEDETISSRKAMEFFANSSHPRSKLLLYSSIDQAFSDKRIIMRNSQYPNLRIKHFSHKSVPFAPDNAHYGTNGDYPFASHQGLRTCVYGAYNRLEVNAYQLLHKYKVLKHTRRELTYNPDFDFAAAHIIQFVCEGP